MAPIAEDKTVFRIVTDTSQYECYLNTSCLAGQCPSSMDLDDTKFLRDLGDLLRERRVARNLTQKQLAEQCQLDRTFIGSVERGERNISILNLRLIARVLRIPLSELFDRSSGTHRSN